MRLLLIEDDVMIGRVVHAGLVDAGHAVDWVRDGRAGQLALAEGVHDLVVLDLGLPQIDGLTLLTELRAAGSDVPVLVATARDAVPERIAGLEAGADDYVLKPYDLDELITRVRVLLRRRAGSGSALLRSGPLVLDTIRRTVSCDGEVVELSAREFAVLEALMHQPGAVVSRERLEDAVYGWGAEVSSNAIEVHLHNLRRKLGAELIKNVRGVGYRVAGDR